MIPGGHLDYRGRQTLSYMTAYRALRCRLAAHQGLRPAAARRRSFANLLWGEVRALAARLRHRGS